MCYSRISRGSTLLCLATNLFQKWKALNILAISVVESQVHLSMPKLLTEDSTYRRGAAVRGSH